MKKTAYILLIILFNFQILYSQDCKANVNIDSGNDDFVIFVDNEYQGNGKVELKLNSGAHIVKIKEPGFRWNARSIEKEIHISDCEENYNYEISIDKEILVDTDPGDASIYSSDTLIGNTPLFIDANIKSIEIEKNDYQPRRLNVSDLSQFKPVKLNFTGEIKSKKFTETPFFEILLGTAVGLGAVAAYYKIQADQSFDKYENTKEPKYLDETNRFDNYSGVAFGILQINFGALIYFLLSDQ